MKSQIKKSNLLFTLLCGMFMVTFFTLSPPTIGHTKDPQKKPGFSIVKPTDKEVKEAPAEAAETAPSDTVETPPPSTDTTTVTPPADGAGGTTIDMEWLLNKENMIAALLMLVLTFLSKWLPILSKITDTGKRALTVGVTVIAGFLFAKFIGPGDVNLADFASLGITYLLTSLGYDKAVKPAGLSTPKVSA